MYPPREDSELLLEAAVEQVDPSDSVLEVGVGSGFVAMRLQQHACYVVGTDVNPVAVEAARERGVPAVYTDIAEAVDADFDLVLFNPPYLPDASDTPDDEMDAALAGGETGVEVALELVDDLDRLLAEDGAALIVVSSHGEPEKFERYIEEQGFAFDVAATEHVFFEDLYVYRLRR